MQKLKQELNANLVGATSSRPCLEDMTLKNQKGITLIALIITIIVMLILVGVTINVALNGGLFSKAEEATTKTKIAQIQEALTIKKAEVLAEHDGVVEEYTLTIDDLSIPTELEKEYESKLIISKDGKLYYDASVVTNKEEQDNFKSMGIQEYVETNTGDSYTFTIADFANNGLLAAKGEEGTVICTEKEFWAEYVSEELKNSKIKVLIGEAEVETYNITCSDSNYLNMFDSGVMSPRPNVFSLYWFDAKIFFGVFNENGEPINMGNYTNYSDLTFTITMAE